ncbi:MAG TPA: hypothetical protein VE976_05485 [Actinomycetota bacterium]|jgi:hypothetical protein|nr:hypothetical protein [Actinomycetota bacterium]
MDRQSVFLLALALLIAAGAMVSAAGWIWLARDRRARRAGLDSAEPVEETGRDG